MNIFDAHISGSLSVSSSAEISGDLTVLGTINATVSGTTSNAISASHAAEYVLTTSFEEFTDSYTTGSFTGSFIGDGTELYNIPASGVTGLNLNKITSGSVSASISPDNGFEVNTDSYFTGSVNISGSLLLNGDVVGVGKLDETTFNSYTSSTDDRLDNIETSTGSVNSFTSSINTTIKTKLDSEGVISGSIQVDITGTTGYSTFSSSITTTTSNLSSSIGGLSSSIATTDLNQTNRLVSIETKTGSYATTGSNLFIGTQTHSGSILPSVDNEYDLGSPTHQWRDVYISSGSLYIDGTKVISSTAQELIITTDEGQSIKILEGTTDSIILQTADGNIELKSSADGDILLDPTNGKITLKGTVEVLNGNKIQSSVGGTPVVFANDIVVSGSIDLTGTIDGIDLTVFSSSVNTRVGNLEGGLTSLNSFSSSTNTRLTNIETSTGSLNSFTSSINTTIKNKLNTETVISGSVQVNITGTTGYSTFSSSVSSDINGLSSSITTINDTQNNRLSSLETSSGSIRTDFNNYTSSNDTINTTQTGRLSSIEGKTGSYATTGSNSFVGNQIVTGSLTITDNFTVLGSSSIVYSTASQLIVEDNVIVVNASFPAERFAGLEIHDSGSNGSVTASLFWDGLNNRFIYRNTSDAHYGGAMFIGGPRNTGSLGEEPSLTNGRIPKSIGGDHIGDSIINEISGSIGISGSIIVSETPLVSGSSQISFNGITDKPTLVSGSSQISFNTITDKPTLVSGSSQIIYGSISGIPSGIISGAAQLPSGVVSGSSQVLTGTGIWSGSAQLPSGVVSGSSQVSFTTISNKPTLVSGSSQISFTSISDKPTLVSGSSQIDLTTTTNYLSGIKTRLNAEGVISGSSQVTLSSTTGYGSVLNQAVLTTSTPTFSTVTATTFAGALSGNASTATNISNTGTVTLASATESNAITITQPSYTTDTPVKLLNFAWYSDIWSLGNIRTGGASSSGLGVYLTNVEKFRFTTTSFLINGNTAYHAGNLTNLNQLTNGPGYITGITSGNVTTALGFTPYNATNPNGYTTNTGTVTSVGGTGTVSGLSLSGTVTSTGNLTLGGTLTLTSGNVTTALGFTPYNSTNPSGYITGISFANVSSKPSTLSGYGISDGIKSNGTLNGNIDSDWGESFTTFDPIPSGTPPLQSPNIRTINIGANYSRRTQLAFDYSSDLAYFRRRQDSSWGSWREFIHSGNIGSQSVSYASTAGNITAYTINQNLGTGNNVKFASHVDLNANGSAFRFYDGSTFRGGLGLDDWAHSGSAANVTLYATGVLHFTAGGTKRAYFNTSGHFLPDANATYDIGSTGNRWRTIYTSDLSLSNGIGDYTIVEGEEKLYLYNNKNKKVYSFVLQEEDPKTATPKLPQ